MIGQKSTWPSVLKKIFYNNTLWGVRILGGINCFVFGVLSLISLLSLYFNITQADLNKLMVLLKQNGVAVTITLDQIKTVSVLYGFIAIGFMLSGWGLLQKKEWARKFTVYFAIGWAGLIFIISITHPAFIRYLFLKMIYPAILILYFTHKNVIQYFKEGNSSEDNSPVNRN